MYETKVQHTITNIKSIQKSTGIENRYPIETKSTSYSSTP
jgi:hypothetical protein